MRNRAKIAAGVAVAAAIALAAPAGAAAKLLDDYYNEGIEPHADLVDSHPLAHARQFTLEFSGSEPDALINASYTVQCRTKGKTRYTRSGTASGVALFDVAVPIPGRFDFCKFPEAQARFDDPFISGWLRIRVFGKR